MFNRVLFSPRPSWNFRHSQNTKLYYAGEYKTVHSLISHCLSSSSIIGGIKTAASKVNGHFAVIYDSPKLCFAVTDHCRSHPIFFSDNRVSNDAHLLKENEHLTEPDLVGVRDASMAGFVTGNRTLFKGLSQLQAGSFAMWDPNAKLPIVDTYNIYQPTLFTQKTKSSLIKDFLSVIDHVVKKIIKRANGRPIWIPLSGGLDSRLILGKLVEHRYSNLFAFTYGPKGNDEAKLARLIAARLGVKWEFFPTSRGEMRQFFLTPERQAYWKFSDGLCSLPNFQDFMTLQGLQRSGSLPPQSIIINGQTGDFISGGHIPAALMAHSVSPQLLISLIIKKHFSLWNSLKTPQTIETLRAELLQRFNISSSAALGREEAVEYYERFEYEERQAKFVINGQRNYEFLQHDWELPLWDKTIVEFWKNIPVDLKYNQTLYREALKAWNFKDIFSFSWPEISHWPGIYKSILIPSRLIRLSFGTSMRDAFLKRMLYFGLYRDQYAPFGYRTFLKSAHDLRSPVSLLSKAWLSELGLVSPINS